MPNTKSRSSFLFDSVLVEGGPSKLLLRRCPYARGVEARVIKHFLLARCSPYLRILFLKKLSWSISLKRLSALDIIAKKRFRISVKEANANFGLSLEAPVHVYCVKTRRSNSLSTRLYATLMLSPFPLDPSSVVYFFIYNAKLKGQPIVFSLKKQNYHLQLERMTG